MKYFQKLAGNLRAILNSLSLKMLRGRRYRSWLEAGLLFGLLGCSSDPQSREISLRESSSADSQSSVNSDNTSFGPFGAAVTKISPAIQLSEIQFGSCSAQDEAQPIWYAMLRTRPNLYLALGDSVYASREVDGSLFNAYLKQSRIPEYRMYRSFVPILAMWDDGDYAMGDGGYSNPRKNEARTEFLKFFPISRDLVPPSRDGVYNSAIIKDASSGRSLQVIMLDTRWNRSELETDQSLAGPGKYVPTQDTSKTLLGETQWKWLDQELQKPADFRILASGIQVIAQDHGFEKWYNFPHERTRLFALLQARQVKNFIFVSGDRHHGEISRLQISKKLSAYDVTASAISRKGSFDTEKNSHRFGDVFYKGNNFGFFRLDWAQCKGEAGLKDDQGNTLNAVEVSICDVKK